MNTGKYNFTKYQTKGNSGVKGGDFVTLTPKASSLSTKAQRLLNGGKFDLYLDADAKALRIVPDANGRYSSKGVAFQNQGYSLVSKGLMPAGRYYAKGEGIYVLQEPETNN